MATKKTTVKKTSKAPVKSPRKSTKSKKSSSPYVSFRLSPNERPFVSFTATRQTLYWLVLSLVILLAGLYIISLQVELNEAYDQVEQSNAEMINEPVSVQKKASIKE